MDIFTLTNIRLLFASTLKLHNYHHVNQGVNSSNQYCPVNEKVSAPHDLAGPKYQNVVEAHKYGVVNPRVKGKVWAKRVYCFIQLGWTLFNCYHYKPVK